MARADIEWVYLAPYDPAIRAYHFRGSVPARLIGIAIVFNQYPVLAVVSERQINRFGIARTQMSLVVVRKMAIDKEIEELPQLQPLTY